MTDANAALMAQGQRKDPTDLIKRDQWGRYLIPDPTTGETKAWTRVSTLIGDLEDTHGLKKWDERNIVYGLGHDEALYARAAACSPDDKKDLGDIAWKAMNLSPNKNRGSNLGTALHRFAERIDKGEITAADVPTAWRGDMLAYAAALERGKLEVVPEWTERVLLIPEVSAAGTADRLVRRVLGQFKGRSHIGDLKSGNVEYGWLKISAQLACYSRATHWYDPATGELHPIMPGLVDQDIAVVFHLPPSSATCRLWAVDVGFGWEAAIHALELREKFRKRKDIASLWEGEDEIPAAAPETAAAAGGAGEAAPPVTGAAPAPEPDESTAVEPGALKASAERVDWLKGRVQTLIDLGHEAELVRHWLVTEAPVPIGYEYSDAQVTLVSEWCHRVETVHEVPFSPLDPLFAPFLAPLMEDPCEGNVEPEPREDKAEDARHWTAMAQAYMEGLSEDDVHAVALAAGLTPEDSRMSARRFDHVCAIVDEMAAPDGGIILTYEGGRAMVAPSTTAADRMMAAAADGDKLTKAATLTRAKAVAKDLGLPAPRGLAQAAEVPLLIALVAKGEGAPVTPSTPTSGA